MSNVPSAPSAVVICGAENGKLQRIR